MSIGDMRMSPEAGGGRKDVGQVTGGMKVLPWDDKMAPVTRKEVFNTMMTPGGLTEEEKALVVRSTYEGCGGMVAAFGSMWFLTRYINWSLFRPFKPFKHFEIVSRLCLSSAAASIPLVYVQQKLLRQVLDLNDYESVFAFQVKRWIICQRGTLLFKKKEIREVTKAEQEAYGNLAAEQATRRQAMLKSGVDVNASMSGQALTPIAQTGYTK